LLLTKKKIKKKKKTKYRYGNTHVQKRSDNRRYFLEIFRIKSNVLKDYGAKTQTMAQKISFIESVTNFRTTFP